MEKTETLSGDTTSQGTEKTVTPSEALITAGQIGKIQELLGAGLRKSRLLSEPVQQVLETRGNNLCEDLMDVVDSYVEAVCFEMVTFRIVRDGRPLEKKIEEGFKHVDRGITSQNFKVVPEVGPAPEEAILVNFGETIYHSRDVVERLEEIGLRPGLPTELVDLSKSYPDSKKLAACFPIIALGDMWLVPDNGYSVAQLNGNVSDRYLEETWWSWEWDDGMRFLAFRASLNEPE